MSFATGREPAFPSANPVRRRHGLIAALVLASAALLASCAAASAQSLTFTPGTRQEFKVPIGVATVEVIAVGGEGGRGSQCDESQGSGPGAGGSGALVTATAPVSGIRSLFIDFNAGGAGGGGNGYDWCAPSGGSGGGSSEVLTDTSAPLVLAGGGGGGGGSMGFGSPEEEESANGGPGASASGAVADGGNGVWAFGSNLTGEGGGGLGGSQLGAGAAGASESNISSWVTSATAASLGTGGRGATLNEASGAPFVGAGGGGGSGLYGGGGGGAGNLDGGGGGAGSSYLDEAAGVRGSVGSGTDQPQAVTINYRIAAPPIAKITEPLSGGAYPEGSVVKTRFSCSDGAGGSGIESCVGSDGASSGSGLLATSTPGSHQYTVSATSRDGESATATIDYTVAGALAPGEPAPATPKTCTSLREITIHALKHLHLKDGVRPVRTEVLLGGHPVARLAGPDPVARVSLVGLPQGSYIVTILARTSRGGLARGAMIYRTCRSRAVAGRPESG